MEIETNEVQKHIDTVLAELETVEVTDQASYESAAEFLRAVKQTENTVHEVLDPQIKELYTPYKAATDERKKYLDILTKAGTQVRGKMNKYQAEQRRIAEETERKRRAEEEERRLAAAVESGREEVLDKPIVVEKVEAPKADGTYTVDVWKWELKDISQVDPRFLIVDEKAVGQLVRSMKGKAQEMVGVGIRVYAEAEVRVKA